MCHKKEMTYDLKFRRHVLATRAREGLSFAQTAARFNLSIQTVFSWSKRLGVIYKKKR